MKKLMFIRLVFVAVSLILTILLFREMEIDSCFDAGGRFNYVTSNCETLQNIEYIPLLDRKSWYRAVLFASFIPAVILLLLYKILMRLLPIQNQKEITK